MGLPFYEIDWGSQGREVMYQDAIGILSQYPYANYNRDPMDPSKNTELHFTYNKSGTNHTVYFQDRVALWERLKLINQYHDIVKGVSFWHLGGEYPSNWDELRSYKSLK
jgi:spore germination protein